MDGLQTIRKEVKKYIDKADEPTLRSVQALLTANEKGDWMNELPPSVIDEIDEALKDLDAGKGIPHAEIAKKYPQWLANAMQKERTGEYVDTEVYLKKLKTK